MIEYKTELEFCKFLNTIAYAMCTDKNNYYIFISLGIHPHKWPEMPLFKSKKLLTNFISVVNQNSWDVAYWKAKEATKDYSNMDLILDFPTDSTYVSAIYKHNLEAWSMYYRCQEIVKDKFQYARIKSEIDQIVFDQEDFFSISDNIADFFVEKEKQIKKGVSTVIIPDFPRLSEVIGGFNPQRLTMLSAKSGFGKTRLAVNLALSAKKIAPVYYFNMEMGKTDFTQLFVQIGASMTAREINTGKYVHKLNQIQSFKESFDHTYKIYATTGKSLTADQVVNKALVYTTEHEMSFVIIDYDQKMTFAGRDEEWRAILRTIEKLEDVAKKTNTHVIVLAQGNDEGDAKSSARAKQPVSAFLNFTKSDDGQYFIKPIKNRWGRPEFELRMNVAVETGVITEGDFIEKNDHPVFQPFTDRVSNGYNKNKVPAIRQYKD